MFDLLHLDGFDLARVPLLTRKKALRTLLAGASEDRVRYGDHVVGQGRAFSERVCALGLEGVVSKRVHGRHVGRRTRDWRKVKCVEREEAVVGGFSEPSGSRTGLGALLLGQRFEGRLRYVGKVGTGFDERTLRALRRRLSALEIDASPFEGAPRGAAARGVHWVRPEMVVEVTFAERTRDGKLRHPVFVGIREDKPATEVVPERAPVAGVKLSNPDKVYFPALGVTKRELAAYYEAVADQLMPHLVDRPLTLVRCPEGAAGACFFARHAFAGMPAALHAIDVGDAEPHLCVRDVEGLVSLAQIGALEIHGWGARAARLERPDQLVFDLDPGAGVRWSEIVAAALSVRARLAELGLKSFVKTTGGKGLHVVVPIRPRLGWDEIKTFTRDVARDLARAEPKRFTATLAKSKRRGKIFVDYLRNGRGATAVCAYSTRAHPTGLVSTPLAWEELEEEAPPPDAFDVRTVRARLRRRAGPWEGFFDTRQGITAVMRHVLDR